MIEKDSEIEEKKRTRKKARIEIKEAKAQPIEIKPVKQPSQKGHKCPHHFGYLSERSKKENIPEDCMTCEKIVQCMLKNVTG